MASQFVPSPTTAPTIGIVHHSPNTEKASGLDHADAEAEHASVPLDEPELTLTDLLGDPGQSVGVLAAQLLDDQPIEIDHGVGSLSERGGQFLASVGQDRHDHPSHLLPRLGRHAVPRPRRDDIEGLRDERVELGRERLFEPSDQTGKIETLDQISR